MLERQNEDVDILDIGDDRPPFEWRSLNPRELITLAVVLALGLVAGGGATLWWQQRQADRALAGEAHVVGYVLPTASDSLNEELCTKVTLRLVNAGQRPITIEAVNVDLARLRMTARCDAPRPTPPAPLAPLGGATWTIPMQVDCSRMSGAQEIRATVRTESGAVRTEAVRVGSYFHDLSSCDMAYVDWSATAAERVAQYDKPALRLRGTFTVAIRWLELEAAGTAGVSAFTVVGGELPKRIGPHPAKGYVDIAVSHCAGATDLNVVTFDLDLETEPSVGAVIALDAGQPEITAELIRLVDDTCGGVL